MNDISITTFFVISSLYVCMVNIKLKYNFVETPRKFITAELSIRKLLLLLLANIIISTDEDPSLRIERSAIINLRGVSTKLYFNLNIIFFVFNAVALCAMNLFFFFTSREYLRTLPNPFGINSSIIFFCFAFTALLAMTVESYLANLYPFLHKNSVTCHD